MREQKTPKKIDRRKFLLQAGGGTLAVGFGAGLTSCSTGGGGGHGSGPPLKFKGAKITGGYKMGPNGAEESVGFELLFEPRNSNNNSSQISSTYDPLSDTWHVENVSEEYIPFATYDLEMYDDMPVELSNLEAVLAPGQSFSFTETSEDSWVVTNTSSSDIQLGGYIVLVPDETLSLEL